MAREVESVDALYITNLSRDYGFKNLVKEREKEREVGDTYNFC